MRSLGGGIFNGGSRDTIRLIDSTVRENTARLGAGIYNSAASLTAERSTIANNEADAADPGLPPVGGGIHNSRGHVMLIESVVRENTAEQGGGIYNDQGHVMLIESGGIRQGTDGFGTASISVINSTVSGNLAGTGSGGISDNGGEVTLSNSTVTRNGGDGAGGIQARATLHNTIVADQLSGTDCAGPITSLGHNLDSDGTCNLTAPGDLPNGDAHLGPLADNGGPTRTHELLEGSDAIGAGEDAVCAAAPVDGVDQRGVRRPQGTACDIGAFELEVPPAPTTMAAEPALLHLEGGLLGGLRVRFLDLSARLVLAETRTPIPDQTVVMTVNRQLGGSRTICTAVTDADGVATCSGALGSLLGLVLGGYTATFAGTDEYEPSSASAPLIRIGS